MLFFSLLYIISICYSITLCIMSRRTHEKHETSTTHTHTHTHEQLLFKYSQYIHPRNSPPNVPLSTFCLFAVLAQHQQIILLCFNWQNRATHHKWIESLAHRSRQHRILQFSQFVSTYQRHTMAI